MLTDVMGGELNVAAHPGEGTRFDIRLFLPSIHGEQLVQELPQAQRIGYVGVRRRHLVVDNEQVDRELLVNILGPLGFQVTQAASGQQCLEDLPRAQPDVIFMDLAMPGIDGWETLRRIRAGQLSAAAIAIISANAFEKGAENDVGITIGDFFTKPLRVEELLDWLGSRLGLEWVRVNRPAPVASALAPAPAIIAPDPVRLAALNELIELGYMRGILNKLEEIEQLSDVHGEFVRVMRTLAGRFQFDAMKEVLRKSADVIH
jgi:CheY-like chemotaxis protein